MIAHTLVFIIFSDRRIDHTNTRTHGQDTGQGFAFQTESTLGGLISQLSTHEQDNDIGFGFYTHTRRE